MRKTAVAAGWARRVLARSAPKRLTSCLRPREGTPSMTDSQDHTGPESSTPQGDLDVDYLYMIACTLVRQTAHDYLDIELFDSTLPELVEKIYLLGRAEGWTACQEIHLRAAGIPAPDGDPK